MTALRLDTAAKIISITADLVGETSPIEIEVHYAIETTNDAKMFVPLDVNCSREWLSVMAKELVKSGQVRFEIPKGLPSAAVKVLGL